MVGKPFVALTTKMIQNYFYSIKHKSLIINTSFKKIFYAWSQLTLILLRHSPLLDNCSIVFRHTSEMIRYIICTPISELNKQLDNSNLLDVF